jgi:hypothetical protein
MFELSEDRLHELVKVLRISDYEEHGQGFMFLELGKRKGLKTGYPQLGFSQFGNDFSLEVTIPSSDPGYDTRRTITLEEMVTFVRVAKKKAPNERMTKELIKKVNTYLTDKQAEITRALELIS